MKLTAETVTKDNVIEYLERKDIDTNVLDEYKKEIVFDDFYGCCEFEKNYENLINKNREEDREKKKRNIFLDIPLFFIILFFFIYYF